MKFRKVEYWLNKQDGSIVERKTFIGRFHTWGQRNDGYLSKFFGVVESQNGECLELDAGQIIFIDAYPIT